MLLYNDVESYERLKFDNKKVIGICLQAQALNRTIKKQHSIPDIKNPKKNVLNLTFSSLFLHSLLTYPRLCVCAVFFSCYFLLFVELRKTHMIHSTSLHLIDHQTHADMLANFYAELRFFFFLQQTVYSLILK